MGHIWSMGSSVLTPDVDDGWVLVQRWSVGVFRVFQAEGWFEGGREEGEPSWDPISPERKFGLSPMGQ